ncbi:energy-coupling factor ABC transporter permease [Cumulibacter manganitolerans]|uniref:energy-coupling factor ABC transporter permease n=1 Tax=Cumulibacter manganitolerans TaxID=1884992 RepID=UPI001E431AA1|nr:energy-coupling factor ABC transporter permease [Cumulibacter manganitolerans]
MHVPDGFLDAPTSIATGVAAAGAVALCLRGARRELDDRTAPLAGIVAAFVFAAQMLNFPVGAGTSGHLLGGALAAALVGPWTGALCVAVVLVVQALVFADGGLTALGTNVLLMAICTVIVSYGVMRLLVAALPRRRGSILVAVCGGALLSVPSAAALFVGLYAVGGAVAVPLPSLAGAMLTVHVLIGLGEALITSLVVGTVLATRPDLVFIARSLRTPLERRRAGAPADEVSA